MAEDRRKNLAALGAETLYDMVKRPIVKQFKNLAMIL